MEPSCQPRWVIQHVNHLVVAQPVRQLPAIVLALHHADIPHGAHLLGNVGLPLPFRIYSPPSDRAVAIIETISAFWGTRPDETTFSSITSPGVVTMS